MINRDDLNKRFKEVFARLEEKGLIVKGSRDGKSRSSFAEKIGTKGHIIQKYLDEEDDRRITFEQAEKLCTHFGVRRDYLLNGRGKMLLSEQEEQIKANSNATLAPKSKGFVFYSSADAFASSTLDISEMEEGQLFELPGIEGHFVAFEVRGQSMSPTIPEGSRVFCQTLEDKSEIEEGGIYAIITKHGLMIKRIQRALDERDICIGLRLISDNKLEYPPFEVDLEEVRRLLRVRQIMKAVD